MSSWLTQNTVTNPTPEGQVILPGVLGGVSWSPTSVDAKKLVAYVPAIHWPVKYTKRVIPASPRQPAVEYTTLEPLMDVPRWGVLSAIDLASGKVKWQRKTDDSHWSGGLLATEGNLVFMGEAGEILMPMTRRLAKCCGGRSIGRRGKCSSNYLSDRWCSVCGGRCRRQSDFWIQGRRYVPGL